MRRFWTSALMPPVGACRYGCGTNCAAPITVFWLFGLVTLVFGFFGGPTGQEGISWLTIGLGLAMWGISAVWTLLTLQGAEEDRCHGTWSTGDYEVLPDEHEDDPFDEIKKAH